MISTPAPIPELLSRLGRLAEKRHTDRDTLLSEAIVAYLEREEHPKLTIEEKIAILFADVPPEERAKVPTDLTDNLDHHIYGTPKK